MAWGFVDWMLRLVGWSFGGFGVASCVLSCVNWQVLVGWGLDLLIDCAWFCYCCAHVSVALLCLV